MDAPMSRSSISRARIMIVDDESSSATLMRAVLATAGFDRVHTYTDPRVALDDYTNAEPDLILLDLHMPHIDGLEFLRRMHSRQHAHGFVPLLVLTADNAADT